MNGGVSSTICWTRCRPARVATKGRQLRHPNVAHDEHDSCRGVEYRSLERGADVKIFSTPSTRIKHAVRLQCSRAQEYSSIGIAADTIVFWGGGVQLLLIHTSGRVGGIAITRAVILPICSSNSAKTHFNLWKPLDSDRLWMHICQTHV